MRKSCFVPSFAVVLIEIVFAIVFSLNGATSANWSHQETRSGKASQIFSLDEKNRRVSFAGLDVVLLDRYAGPLPVIVRADCLAQNETPPLAIDPATFGAAARLLNLTRLPDNQCVAYQVVAQAAGGSASTAARASNESPGIAVIVHHSSPPPAGDLLKEPAVFVFNPVHGNWTEAKPFTPPNAEPQHVYATLLEQSQRIISGVIALPDASQQQPARNDTASLTRPLEQISPTSGYLSIDRIEPDNKGAYSVNLPLLLRPSRGPGPSFSIRYSSQGAPGVLGRGWDLSISTIEVRGPSPIYNPQYETEDYVLDGMDLIALDGDGTDVAPLYKGGPILPRVPAPRLFHPRNNSSGLIVRRYGNSPTEYYWEVWDPNSHVTRLYGGEFAGNETQPVPSHGPGGNFLKGTVASESGLIGQWALTQEFDSQTARNGTRYAYEQDEARGRGCVDTSAWGGSDCRAALRLSRVEYNTAINNNTLFAGGVKLDLSGVTRVEFGWEKRDLTRYNSDGRLGFFRAQEHWLKTLTVLYQRVPKNPLFTGVSLRDQQLPPADPKRPDPALPNEDESGFILFAKHRFILESNSACMNFDTYLSSYEVEGNTKYDWSEAKGVVAPLEKQTFSFSYEGDRTTSNDGHCAREWSGKEVPNLGTLPEKAVDGSIGFPSGLVSSLGKGLLVGRSLLGTSRTQETGASMYVGIGLAGSTDDKSNTVGVKGGINFSKSEGNSTLVDVTGDGIDDIVYRDGGGLKYCAGERQSDDSIVYLDSHCGTIEGISEFSLSSASTISIGVEFYPGFTSFAGIGLNSSNSNTYVYFTDRDGDGLIDLVAYGQVFYGQGEDSRRRVVGFAPRSALTPPIPQQSTPRLATRVPADIRSTIKDIEARLEAVSERLRRLRYTQTTVAWEAPLDGTVTIAGAFATGTSTTVADDLGTLSEFGPRQFEQLYAEVKNNQKDYIDPRYPDAVDRSLGCNKWSEADTCHSVYSDPFRPHYAVRSAQISFPDTPKPKVQISLFKKTTGQVLVCLPDDDFDNNGEYSFAGKTFADACHKANPHGEQIRVESGDVIYLTYSVHPHFRKWLRPDASIQYVQVDDDPAFNLIGHDPNGLLDRLSCKWKEETKSASPDCLLASQTRYRFDLKTGLLPYAPHAMTRLPAGTDRQFSGRFEIPSDLTRDYQVFFEVLGAPTPIADKAFDSINDVPKSSFQTIPNVAPTLLFRQDVSDICRGIRGTCIVDVRRNCEAEQQKVCGEFTGDYVLSTRITVLHKVKGVELPARNISDRLSALKWRVAPQVTSYLKDKDAPANAIKRRTTTYLPVTMGDPDLEYVRVEQGRFANVDSRLNDTGATIDFSAVLSDEKRNVNLARLRQTAGLCGFAREIIGFLRSHFSSSGQPYADDYLEFWQSRYRTAYESRCEATLASLRKVALTDNAQLDIGLTNGLRLPAILQNLRYAEQVTSAETLLERVLANLALGEEFLTDGPRLTRRGYRLPLKVNPLDCETMARINRAGKPPVPLDEAIVGSEGPCAYRISTNFAMQRLEDLGIGEDDANNIREMLGRFAKSNQAAFNIELTATVNGKPVSFRELTGSETGNQTCEPTTTKTCIGNYGTGTPPDDPVEDYFYPPPRKGKSDTHGDVFQRITANKRAGRAVAFSSGIISGSMARADCPHNLPDYHSLGEMELKQDCLVGNSDITADQKYKAGELYRVEYSIGENNQFDGRNRVLEFRASPLDVVEFRYRISGAQNAVFPDPSNADDKITGKFSIFEAKNDPTNPPMGLQPGRHLIPRSPSQILPGGDVDIQCRKAPDVPARNYTGSDLLLTKCRPWTRLGWTETLLGAQYRTYSDAEKIRPGLPSDTFSILRRREILRLQPEIEVEADGYVLEHRDDQLPVVEALVRDSNGRVPYRYRQIFDRNDPNVFKTGGDWVLFAGRTQFSGDAKLLDTLSPLPPFVAYPFASARPARSLRYGPKIVPTGIDGQDPDQAKKGFFDARSACTTDDHADYGRCSATLGTKGDLALSLDAFDFFPLAHRFVGPANVATAVQLRGANPVRPETSVCAAEYPTLVASCWLGVDDTVFLEMATLDSDGPNLPVYSVSALRGAERPPLVQFISEFSTYRKLACNDPEGLRDACSSLDSSEIVSPDRARNPDPLLPDPLPAFPNRPLPPEVAVDVFAPVQSMESQSISANVGNDYANIDAARTTRSTTRLFQDINGDGFPDVITNGVAELTSPVGLSRRDWWTYFRARRDAPTPGLPLLAGDYEQSGVSSNKGAGVGLSASTFANILKPRGSGSPDANVDPGFSASLDDGYDDRFIDLRDFNGDGLPDRVQGTTTDAGLTLSFNTGNALRGPSTITGKGLSTIHYNTTHGAGLGVRLGYSWGAASFVAGAGLNHHDGGSQAALIDFTGDGRPDLVLPDGDGAFRVYPNLGNGFDPANYRIHRLNDWRLSFRNEFGVDLGMQTQMSETTLVDAGAGFTFGFDVWFLKIAFSPQFKTSHNQTRELFNIRDLNGDGVPDIVSVNGEFPSLPGADRVHTQVHYNPDGKYYLLAGVKNPSGSELVLRHGLYGNSGPEHGRPVWALTAVARFDGFEPTKVATKQELPPDGQDVLLTTYDYAHGYYNRAERQFYGFAERKSTVYGCDVGTEGKPGCLGVVRDVAALAKESLKGAGYVELQRVQQTFANRDYLTQGLELSRTVAGTKSPARPEDTPQVVSRNLFGYSIDDLSHLPGSGGACMVPSQPLSASWSIDSEAIKTSSLSPTWDGRAFHDNGRIFGSGSICGTSVQSCVRRLSETMCSDGFMREQTAFWAQQSGAVRQRLVTQESFGDKPTAGTIDVIDPDISRLRSATAFDHDQWGQVLRLNSIVEASRSWDFVEESSANAEVVYAPLQGKNAFRRSNCEDLKEAERPGCRADVADGKLNSLKGANCTDLQDKDKHTRCGYPLLGLAETIRIYSGPTHADTDVAPALRAREAIYADDGRGNLSDICVYPGGKGFIFSPGICKAFRDSMTSTLAHGYASVQSSLRTTYDTVPGLPKGVSEFNAIIHHQLAAYDEFGNLTHSISPLSDNKEWIERRYNYDNDPFRRTATETRLTRCVNAVAGAGTDSDGYAHEHEPDAGCTYGLAALPEPVRRKAITHASQLRVDTHFGAVAETRDINGNSILQDFDRWGRLRLLARSWGNPAPENRTFKDGLQLALDKTDRPTSTAKAAVKDWRLLAIVDYAKLSDGLLRSNVRRFENSDSYAGLLSRGNTTRETALLSDGLGRPIQSIREADVCLGARDEIIDGPGGPPPSADLRARCTGVATAIVTPSTSIDALGRDLQSFEPYRYDSNRLAGKQPGLGPGNEPRASVDLRFTGLANIPDPGNDPPQFLTRTTYDGGSRPVLVETRLSQVDTSKTDAVQGSTQYRYLVRQDGDAPARFEALTLSPRCTASALWSDARGLKRTVMEDQRNFYLKGAVLGLGDPPLESGAPVERYKRLYEKTLGYCQKIDELAVSDDWTRVSYAYDQLQQLTDVDYPLDAGARAAIRVRLDQVGRTLQINEPDSGCTRFAYDGLNALTAEAGFRYEDKSGSDCGTSSRVRNEKSYTYSGGRLLEMAYHSLEEQGGVDDRRDTVRFYYDRYPQAKLHGETQEASRFVPNDEANTRFIETTNRKCDNCIGQMTVVRDRTGARAFFYNELGQVSRETRSIVAPLVRVKPNRGGSETYLPEVAFYEVDHAYTAFGDPVRDAFAERPPTNPADACIEAGVYTCLATFSIGRRYGPDGTIAQLLFNDHPLIESAQDTLSRPAVRWTSNGLTTGYRYDPFDLRLNQMTTLTAAGAGATSRPVQVNGYQYDGGGNVLGYANRATAMEAYESGFEFQYDAANRLIHFKAAAARGTQGLLSHGDYAYDAGHRFTDRSLSIQGGSAVPGKVTPKGTSFDRSWKYDYASDATKGPLHAPRSIAFALDKNPASGRTSLFGYDDLGRMTQIVSAKPGDDRLGLLSDRAMTWDAEGRLARVRGIADTASPDNVKLLQEDYVYDSGGNRTLRIDNPRVKQPDGRDIEAATIYMTPFYARPYDRRGTVVLSQGSLPTASLTPPASPSESPIVTYLYADLPVGSMTAGVTVFGEPTDPGSITIARREYEPYGLELTTDDLARTGRDGTAPMSVFHGKELDRVTNFSSFGARYYSRDLGIWLKPDPMMLAYFAGAPNGGVYRLGNLDPYAFVNGDPLGQGDPTGRCPWCVGAVVGAGVDLAVQGALVYAGAQDRISWTSVAISAASGATGVGLSSVVAKSAARYAASRAIVMGATIAGETAIGVGEQYLRGGEVDVGTAALNVIGGELIGAAAGRATKAFLKWKIARSVERGLPIPEGLSTSIHLGQQGKHIRGHNNYIEGRSYLHDGVDPKELLAGVHSGEFPIIGKGSRANPIVDFGRDIGVDAGSGLSTPYGQIHSGKAGAHIVPHNPNILE